MLQKIECFCKEGLPKKVFVNLNLVQSVRSAVMDDIAFSPYTPNDGPFYRIDMENGTHYVAWRDDEMAKTFGLPEEPKPTKEQVDKYKEVYEKIVKRTKERKKEKLNEQQK